MSSHTNFTLENQPDPEEVIEMASHATAIFNPIPRESMMIDGFDVYLKPISLDPIKGDIEFIMEKDEMHYTSPNIYVYCKFKITNNGTDLTADEDVAPINLFGQSFFQSCHLMANDTRVTENTSDSLGYKNYIEAIVSHGYDSRKSSLQSAMYYRDTDGKFDVTIKSGGNDGYNKRQKLVATSNECEFIAKVGLDILTIDRFLPPGVKLGFRFTRNDPTFYLLTKKVGTNAIPNYRGEVLDIHLIIRKIRLRDDILLKHKKMFANGGVAQYPYTKSVIKRRVIPKSNLSDYWISAFTGPIPQIILIALVETSAETGNIEANPFHFKHFNLTHLCTKIDGVMHPTGGYNVDIEKGLYWKMLRNFYDNLGHTNNSGCVIDYENFKDGYFFPCFNYNPDKQGSLLKKSGSVDIELKFKTALSSSITILAL